MAGRAYSECGLFVHPLASTVTYLSSEGAPTLVVDARLSPEGKYVEAVGDAHIVPPRVGRHVRFDGRLLHGAPLELLEARGDESPYVRVTFLVNIWIGHKPRGCARYRPPHSAVAISRTPVRLRAAAATTAARRVSEHASGGGETPRFAVAQTDEARSCGCPSPSRRPPPRGAARWCALAGASCAGQVMMV